jgi:hypothetical protein
MASDIHWDAMKRALTSVPLARRLFITKHATGMCGVGKFMRLWGKRDTDSCPRCGASENTSHVWKCPQEQATQVWDLSLQKLQEWMVDVGTLPDMRDSILHYLDTWRSANSITLRRTTFNCSFQDFQGECGWQSFLEGFNTKDWATMQHSFHSSRQASRNGWRWLSELIKKLWATAWDQWEHRNAVLHDGENLVQ